MRTVSRTFEFSIWGSRALFTDPMSKIGGEKISFPVPTYDALRGIVSSIYWQPCLEWIIDEVRVMNPISYEAEGQRPFLMKGGRGIQSASYLIFPSYQVRCHFEWNMARPDLREDMIFRKHEAIAGRMLRVGGRRTPFLGTSECSGFAEKVRFGSGEGFYDGTGRKEFGFMYHGMTYPDGIQEGSEKHITVRFSDIAMEDGIIRFPRPDGCTVTKALSPLEERKFRKRRRNDGTAERSERYI